MTDPQKGKNLKIYKRSFLSKCAKSKWFSEEFFQTLKEQIPGVIFK